MRKLSGLLGAISIAALLMMLVNPQAWANGTWYANFRGGTEAIVALGDTCDEKNGNDVVHDIPNGQLQFTFHGGMRGEDVYIHDVVIKVGPGRDGFLFNGSVRVYGSGGVVDGHPGHLGPNQSYQFIVDRSYRSRAAVEFFPQVGFDGVLGPGSCGVTQIGVQKFDQ